jgi:Ca2+-binding EF-hand superfamily protein
MRSRERGKHYIVYIIPATLVLCQAQVDHDDARGGGLTSMRAKWGRLKHEEVAAKAWDRVLFAADQAPRAWPGRLTKMFKAFGESPATGSPAASGAPAAARALSLDVRQLGPGLRSLGVKIKLSEAKALAQDMDESGDGAITLAEFTEAVTRRQVAKAWTPILRLAMGRDTIDGAATVSWDAQVTAAFEQFDLDGDGQLDLAELALGLRKLGVVLFLPEVLC